MQRARADSRRAAQTEGAGGGEEIEMVRLSNKDGQDGRSGTPSGKVRPAEDETGQGEDEVHGNDTPCRCLALSLCVCCCFCV